MTLIEAVRAKVIEAVPEIVSTVPGCKLRIFQREMVFVHLQTRENGDHTLWYTAPNGTLHNGSYTTPEIEEIAIIGRPITLADVLRAISEKQKADASVPVWAIDPSGEFFDQSTSDGSPIYLGVVWNLTLPLDEQEPEVIEFLHKILCV